MSVSREVSSCDCQSAEMKGAICGRLSFTSQSALGRSATVAERPAAVYGYGHADNRFAAVHKIAVLTRELALGPIAAAHIKKSVTPKS